MITKEQIEAAARRYESDCLRQDLSYADVDFAAGAEWAADQIEAEKKDAAEKINQLVLENNRLSAALARLTEHIAELQKTLEKLNYAD